MIRIKTAAAFFAGLILLAATQVAFAQSGASPNDTARYLAGMDPGADSQIVRLTRDAHWQQHAKQFDAAWGTLEKQQLSKVRNWSETNLKVPARPLIYTFSGPDFIYANSFFPEATTYVMAGLEPVGLIPSVGCRRAGSFNKGNTK